MFSPVPAGGRTRRISLGQPMHPPKGELLTLTKPEKLMHPAVSTIKDGNLIYLMKSLIEPPMGSTKLHTVCYN